MRFDVPKHFANLAGIYAITNLVSGRRYVGSGGCFIQRYQTHLSTLRHGKHRNRLLQSEFSKIGEGGFSFGILEVVKDATRLTEVEQTYLDRLFGHESCYNLAPQASSSVIGHDDTPVAVQCSNEAGEWRSIVGFVGYEVSSAGQVRSYHMPGRTRKMRTIPAILSLVPARKRGGYLLVLLRRNHKSYARYVHHLVLQAFKGPCPPGMQARHVKDRDVTNNTAGNLEWGTAEENMADKIRHGTSQHGERNHRCKLSDADVAVIRASPLRGCELARQYGVRDSQISRIRNGVRRGPPIC